MRKGRKGKATKKGNGNRKGKGKKKKRKKMYTNAGSTPNITKAKCIFVKVQFADITYKDTILFTLKSEVYILYL